MAAHASPGEYMARLIGTLLTNALGLRRVRNLRRKLMRRFCLRLRLRFMVMLRLFRRLKLGGRVNPIGPRSCYDEGKQFAEALLVAYCMEWGLDVRVHRIFNTCNVRLREDSLYGRALSHFALQTLTGQSVTVYGDSLQKRSFVMFLTRLLGCCWL